MMPWTLRTLLLTSVATIGIVIFAACGDGDDDGGQPQASPPAGAAVNPNSGLQGGLAEFDIDAVTWNSYWYSRYNLGTLAMMSGLGVTFEPPVEAVQAMVQMVDQGPEDGEHVVMPKNAALLRAVFAGGDAQFVAAPNGDPTDLSNYRWDPAKMDTTLTPSAQAQAIIKEVEWAKFFNGGWAGGVTDAFGAMDRFKGIVLFAEAKQQADFALQNLRNEDGLFIASARFSDDQVVPEDASVQAGDQYQMLQALADLHMVLQRPELYNGIYADDEFRDLVGQAADELFAKVVDLEPSGVAELSLGTQALTWFAATTEDDDLREQALGELRSLGDELAAAPRAGTVERAVAIRGLVESGRVLGEAAHLDAAAEDFQALLDAYDPATGSFADVSTLSNWQVGDILGALNTLRLNAGDAVQEDEVERTLIGFFEAVINKGGLMQAVIPKEMEASPFELERVTNDLFFAYPGIPTPDAAGGPYGSAAVDAGELRFDAGAGRWEVSDRRFDTAGAMHTSNEMLWTFGFISGFPTVEGASALAQPAATE